MTLRVDPEKNEVYALKDVMDWRSKSVLEIGCGDGRLTRRLAQLGATIRAIDPDAKRIRMARKALPQRFKKLVRYRVGHVGRLDYADQTFDAVVFAWSL